MAARADIAVEVIDRHTPIEPTQTSAVVADYHKFLNDGRTFLFLIGGTADCLLTVQTPGTVDGLAIDDVTFTVPLGATEFRMMGPFPPSIYNQADGKVYIDWQDANVANVKVAVIRLPV